MQTRAVILMGLFSFLPAAGFCAGQEAGALAVRLARRVQEASACPLYANQRAELETYYNRKDFSDPARQTGWYRVDDYLAWLQKEEPRLKALSINVWYEQIPVCQMLSAGEDSPSARKQLTVYLGARYALDRLERDASLDAVAFYMHPYRGAADFTHKTLFIPQHVPYNPAQFINLGVHEMAHLLPAVLPGGAEESLGELAAFYTQTRFALPLKPHAGICYSNGVRHIVNTLSRADACRGVLREYNSFLAGALPGSRLTRAALPSYRLSSGRERAVGEVVFHLVLLRGGKLFFEENGKKRVPSEKEYLAAQLPEGFSVKPLASFYKKLLALLPPEVTDAGAYEPVILPAPGEAEAEDVHSMMAQEEVLSVFLRRHEQTLTDALYAALKQTGVKSPRLPDGYI